MKLLNTITFILLLYIVHGQNKFEQNIKTENDALQLINHQIDSVIYITVDSYPEFHYSNSDNTFKALEKFFRQYYKMPQILTDNGYFGKIYVNCIVENDGSLSRVKIEKGIEETLDESIINFLNKMPRWIPAKINNENVRCEYTFPIDIKWLYGEIK